MRSQDMAALFDWPGTHDPTAWFTVPCALDFLENLHPDGLEALRAESVSLRAAADDLLGSVLPRLSTQTDRHGWMTTFKLPNASGPPLSALEIDPYQRALNRDFGIQVPVTYWPEWPNRVIRFSVAPYNILDDYHFLRDAIMQMVGGHHA